VKNNPVVKTVPQRFVADLIAYLGLDITTVRRIEMDYRAVTVYQTVVDENGKIFVGPNGEIGTQATDYPFQKWEDYEKETTNGNAT